jgi:chemotaxis protein MotB
MIARLTRHLAVGPALCAVVVAGCVMKSKYDALELQNRRLQEQIDAQEDEITAADMQVSRLQGAIKYTVNSDLLFPPGGWEMGNEGKQVIGKFAAKLAPTQQNKLVVNGYTDDAPVGPDLVKKGITSNEVLSQKRAENVMQFLISQGVKPDLVSAHGYGDANPVASNATPEGRA